MRQGFLYSELRQRESDPGKFEVGRNRLYMHRNCFILSVFCQSKSKDFCVMDTFFRAQLHTYWVMRYACIKCKCETSILYKSQFTPPSNSPWIQCGQLSWLSPSLKLASFSINCLLLSWTPDAAVKFSSKFCYCPSPTQHEKFEYKCWFINEFAAAHLSLPRVPGSEYSQTEIAVRQ